VVVIPAAHLRDGASVAGQERYEIIWRYRKHRVSPEAVQVLIKNYSEILTAAARQPETTLKDLWCLGKTPASDGRTHTSLIEPARGNGSAATPGGSAPELSPEILTRLSCSIIAEVLRLPSVKPEDNFFDLGGHSLAATRVIARLREAVSESLPLSIVFNADTVAELGNMIANHCRE
jgi:acyl carrier protein